jgi:hypothetical protein
MLGNWAISIRHAQSHYAALVVFSFSVSATATDNLLKSEKLSISKKNPNPD